MGNYFYAEGNILFIKDSKTVLVVFRLFCLAAIFFGAREQLQPGMEPRRYLHGHSWPSLTLWRFCYWASGRIKALDDYTAQRKQGVNPVFGAQGTFPAMPKTMLVDAGREVPLAPTHLPDSGADLVRGCSAKDSGH